MKLVLSSLFFNFNYNKKLVDIETLYVENIINANKITLPYYRL